MSEIIEICLLGLAHGTLFALLIEFIVWIIYKAKSRKRGISNDKQKEKNRK